MSGNQLVDMGRGSKEGGGEREGRGEKGEGGRRGREEREGGEGEREGRAHIVGQVLLKLPPGEVEELVGDVTLHHVNEVLQLMPAGHTGSHRKPHPQPHPLPPVTLTCGSATLCTAISPAPHLGRVNVMSCDHHVTIM